MGVSIELHITHIVRVLHILCVMRVMRVMHVMHLVRAGALTVAGSLEGNMGAKKWKEQNGLWHKIAQLEAAGYSTEAGAAVSATVRQLYGPPANQLVQLVSTLTNILVTVEISNTGHDCFLVRDVHLAIPTQEGPISLCPDPRESRRGDDMYDFPCPIPVRCRRDEVLNHRIGQLCLRPGEPITGILLWNGWRINENFRHGIPVNAEIALQDQFERWHSSRIELMVDRQSCLKFSRSAQRRERSGLFSGGTETTEPARLRTRSSSKPGRVF